MRVMPKMNAPDLASRLTFAGAAGTVTGSKARAGARSRTAPARSISMGDFVCVRAEVAMIQGLSAHADQSEILRWLRGFAPARTLATTIDGELGWPANVAHDRQNVVPPSRTTRNPTGDKL
ncbi:MAG TPA: MBL fold metallo-hydrolase RNA specificity domain-containing protein [Polyangiales bacterium]|nr:MBL fold metallo-hydrolase RNA specificity domain-containing protein [Polyangiales bacterium]